MLVLAISFVVGLAEECTKLGNGLVISKYYLSECSACKLISPVLDEIKSKLERERVPVEVREVECTECDCPGITHFPTVEITRDKLPEGRVVGYKDYRTLSKWMADKLELKPEIFEGIIKHTDGKVTELQARDFLSGFDGQWLILFYSSASDPVREHIKTAASEVGRAVHFGEISKKAAKNVTNRFNIVEYPYLVGINHGTVVPYAGEHTVNEITKFATKLGRRSFESLTYKQLKAMEHELKKGEPIYIVLYKDYELASHYYNDLAQQFKFRATIYKSNDPNMFEAAGFEPEGANEEDRTANHTKETDKHGNDSGKQILAEHSKMVHLVVFRNGTFHHAPNNLEEGPSIIQWIFHTHFPHVTEITNSNFYTVFHGIKPVLVLLSRGELADELERLSANMHLGMPYINFIFATLDVGEYPQFHQEVLPTVIDPALAIYDPMKHTWYHEPAELTSENIEQKGRLMIEKYMNGKLAKYPPEKRKWSYYIIGMWVVGVIAYFALKGMSQRGKLE